MGSSKPTRESFEELVELLEGIYEIGDARVFAFEILETLKLEPLWVRTDKRKAIAEQELRVMRTQLSNAEFKFNRDFPSEDPGF